MLLLRVVYAECTSLLSVVVCVQTPNAAASPKPRLLLRAVLTLTPACPLWRRRPSELGCCVESCIFAYVTLTRVQLSNGPKKTTPHALFTATKENIDDGEKKGLAKNEDHSFPFPFLCETVNVPTCAPWPPHTHTHTAFPHHRVAGVKTNLRRWVYIITPVVL